MEKSARRATAIDRANLFFMARDYSKASGCPEAQTCFVGSDIARSDGWRRLSVCATHSETTPEMQRRRRSAGLCLNQKIAHPARLRRLSALVKPPETQKAQRS